MFFTIILKSGVKTVEFVNKRKNCKKNIVKIVKLVIIITTKNKITKKHLYHMIQMVIQFF